MSAVIDVNWVSQAGVAMGLTRSPRRVTQNTMRTSASFHLRAKTLTPTPSVAGRAEAIRAGVIRLLADWDFAGVAEVPLKNGRRADLVGLGPKGELLIVEIKSGLADFAADQKWPEYAPFCDRFYFAVDQEFPIERIPEHAGLIIADQFGGALMRNSALDPVAPARRKAMTLKLARLAAARLCRQP